MTPMGSLRQYLAGERGIILSGERRWVMGRKGEKRREIGIHGGEAGIGKGRCWKEEGSAAAVTSPAPAATTADVFGGAGKGSSEFDVEALEVVIEKAVYRCRFFALLGVSGSLLGSVLCYFKGCVYIATAYLDYLSSQGKAMSSIIEAIDIYLIGTVMLVFAMGIYELFICNLDIAKKSRERSNFLGLFALQERPKWLEIKSVNELKTKLGHVIVMALLVGLFDKIQKVGIVSPVDLLCLTASILLSSGGLLLLSKLSHSTHK